VAGGKPIVVFIIDSALQLVMRAQRLDTWDLQMLANEFVRQNELKTTEITKIV